MKEEQFYIHSVKISWILFDCITCQYVNNRFILHLVQFERIWKPNLSVHVKMAKLASIPPRWDKLAPNKPQMVKNGGVEVYKVCWRNYDSLACIGVQSKVTRRLKLGIKCSNNPKNGLKPPLALLVNHNS